MESPLDKCTHMLFEEQAELHPDSTAVICKHEQITYRDLNKKASQLAFYLNQKGVHNESLVGIFMERSINMVTGLLGIMKAGAAYVPLDPVYPGDRLVHMIDDADLSLILTDTSVEQMLPPVEKDILRLDSDWEKIVDENRKTNENKVLNRKGSTTGNLAYVIFTSGSTGKPKGVEVLHSGLTNFLNSMAKTPGFTSSDHMFALTTICFDISALEIFLPLVTGGVVEMVPSNIARDGIKLKRELENSKATVIQATPASYQMLIAAEWDQKTPIKILCGGEPLTARLAEELLKQGNEIWNMYGPTETTIWSSIQKLTTHENISIGSPIANTSFFILDENLNAVPDGESGELYIGGDGLARGYLKRPNLTKERFVPDPADGNQKIYRTGDLARRMNDGTFECLGRIDNQVKVNGFRIELAEIEAVLEQQESIQTAVVVIREDIDDHKALVAFLIAEKADHGLKKEFLENALKEFLPHYMIPNAFHFLDAFPLTLNRKVDRKQITEMELADIFLIFGKQNVDKESNDETEGKAGILIDYSSMVRLKAQIQNVVAEILKTEPLEIATERNLREYGFDPLRFTILGQRLNREYQLGVDIEFFLRSPTIDQICTHLLTSFPDDIEQSFQLAIPGGVDKQAFPSLEQVVAKPVEETFCRQSAESPEDFLNDIQSIAADILKRNSHEISTEVNLGEYGFDSVRFTLLAQRINRRYQLGIDADFFYRCTSIEQICSVLATSSQSDIERYHSSGQTKDTNDVSPLSPSPETPKETEKLIYPLSRKVRDGLTVNIQNIAAGILKRDSNEISMGANLGEYGFDSVRFTILAQKLNKKYQIAVDAEIFYEYSSIEQICLHLLDIYPDECNTTHAETLPKPGDNKAVPKVFQDKPGKTEDNEYLHRASDIPAVAIIGMSGIMPQSKDLNEFWKNIEAENNLVTEIPRSRWDVRDYADESTDLASSKWCGLLNGIDEFDAFFFNISPREAQTMDPQQRLFIEVVWKTIEDAGYNPLDFRGHQTAVFVGVVGSDYWDIASNHASNIDNHSLTGKVHAIISNRISYLLDLHGPSETIDTACSSSAVAIHRACKAITNGDCDTAIAGGVNIILNPLLHKALVKNGMMSKDGKCKTFDSKADGYVRGEGVGAVLLKSLTKAIADRDHIHALIRSSAENNDGKSVSLTAPNPQYQAELLVKAYNDAAINPSHVSYIEAHGTGTNLGDPIEINGLKSAFETLYKQWDLEPGQPHCGLGSVKTNIGHLEASAGIAGVLKVLLMMRYEKIPGNVHLNEINPRINLNDSPFYAVRNTRDWEHLRDRSGAKIPRCAGVSSFGLGGTNVHVVLEEHENRFEIQDNGLIKRDGPNNLHVILLSAKNEERLKAYAAELTAFLEVDSLQRHCSLQDIAYTLQIGREAMEERLALVVSSKQDAIDKLARYTRGEKDIRYLFRGNAKSEKVITNCLFEGKEGKEFLTALLKNKRYDKPAQLWTHGVNIDWKIQYRSEPPNRIPLPTYPFTPDRHWIKHESQVHSKIAGRIHPLVDDINFELSLDQDGCLVFHKKMSKEDSFVKDHIVDGQLILPGVAHMEMAYAAMHQSKKDRNFSLANMVFIKPLIITKDPTDIYLVLKRENNRFQYEILIGEDEEKTVCSRGYFLQYDSKVKKKDQFLSLESIQSRCIHRIDKTDLYAGYQELGIEFGTYFQPLKELWVNEEESLGLIEIQSGYRSDFQRYFLYPALMEGALQTMSGFKILKETENKTAYFPFSIGKLEVRNPLEPRMYVYSKVVDEGYDVEIMDTDGKTCVKLHNVTIRKQKDNLSDLFYVTKWEESGIPENGESHNNRARVNQKTGVVIYDTDNAALIESLATIDRYERIIRIELGHKTKRISDDNWIVETTDTHGFDRILGDLEKIDAIHFLSGININEPDVSIIEVSDQCQERGVLSLFRLIKSLARNGFTQNPIKVTVVTNNVVSVLPGEQIRPHFASLHGLARTIMLEYPNLKVRCIDYGIGDIINAKAENARLDFDATPNLVCKDNGELVAIRNGKHYSRKVYGTSLPRAKRYSFRKKGVYLILGGAGGIGFETACQLAESINARVILTGRSKPDATINEKLSKIKAKGGEAIYIQAEATDVESMKNVVKEGKNRFGMINGAFHSAMVLDNKTIDDMDEESFTAVLAPKVKGCIVLHHVLYEEKLDFMVFFSSVQYFSGYAGQSNYTAACTFEDAFSLYLDQTAPYPVKVINWGYWGDVGAVASKKYNKLMAAKGVGAIKVQDGMEAIQRILANGEAQVIFYKAKTHVLKSMGFQYEQEITNYPDEIPATLGIISQSIGRSAVRSKRQSREIREAFGLLEDYGRYSLLRSFQQMGVFQHRDITYDIDRLKKSLGIMPLYDRLYDSLIELFETAGFTVRDKNRIVTTSLVDERQKNVSRESLNELKLHIKDQYPDLAPYTDLLFTCLNRYQEILQGDVPATDVMFPGSSLKLVETIYKGNRINDYYNEIIAQSVLLYIEARQPKKNGKPIKILEVGAGTGSSSVVVLKEIQKYGDMLHYQYTDISRAFTLQFQKKYGEKYPFVEFNILDLEKDPLEQGFNAGDFDLIIATNVLHAVKDIKHTIKRVKTLLKTNGCLIINESTGVQEFLTLTFGTLKGWWLYEDDHLRLKHSPLLDYRTWESILREEGYRQINYFGDSNIKEKNLAQHVIIAESDGKILLERKLEEKVATAFPFGKKTDHRVSEPLAETDSVHATRAISQPEIQKGDKATQHHNPTTLTTTSFIEKTLIGCLCKSLGINRQQIDVEQQFKDLGLDSIIGVEFVSDVNAKLDVMLKPTIIFNFTNIRDLTGHIDENYADRIGIKVQMSKLQNDEYVEMISSVSADDLSKPVNQDRNGTGINGSATQAVNDDALSEFTVDRLRDVICECLAMKREPLDVDKEFSEYGIDSLISVELIKKLNDNFDILLKPTVIFNYTSIYSLSKHIVDQFNQKVKSAYIRGNFKPHQTDRVVFKEGSRTIKESVSETGKTGNHYIDRQDQKATVALPEMAEKRPQETDEDGYKAVFINKPGNIEDIEIRSIRPDDPGDHDVQIRIKAFSLNFADFLSIKGLYPNMPDYPFIPGSEVSGVVTKKGRNVTEFEIGEKVIGITMENMGGQSYIINLHESSIVKKPLNVTYEEACAFPVVFSTVNLAFQKADSKPGEKILIQSAASGVGLVAIQIALLRGAEVFATASSQEKLDFLKKKGAHHVINYEEVDFEKQILEITENNGIDVVINTLSGDAIQKGINLLAPNGRYIEFAMAGLKTTAKINLSNMVDNQSFYSIDLKRMMSLPEKRSEILLNMVEALETGQIKPSIGSVIPFSEIRSAYYRIQDRKSIGKTVITVPDTPADIHFRSIHDNELVAGSRSSTDVKPERIQNIAVIGMSGRFPGAENIDRYWNNLTQGKSSISEVPKERWDIDSYYDPDPNNMLKTYCRYGGFIDNIDQFDPLFFNMTGTEAEVSDPQQRLFLEESWKALEDAGYSQENMLNSKCGVFVGGGNGDYLSIIDKAGKGRIPQSFWGNTASIVPARVSYFLNLKGPSIAIDTACSSSLVAVHIACKNLAENEIDMALAGGVFINNTPNFHVMASNAQMLSPNGKCKTFDNSADGFIPGEGVGVIVLKRLNEALDNGDQIYGVIKGSGVNQDGKTNGITAPSSLSQADVELNVYKKFNIDPESITYIETHGTGTKLGDPIEMDALIKSFSEFTAKKQFCGVGSVKTNIGHAAAAAGIAGVIKVLLSLKFKKLPPSLNYEVPNQHINFDESPFFVIDTLKEWKPDKNGMPLTAAVNSFGFSGTNAHIIIEEAPQRRPRNSSPMRPFYLIPLSAKTQNVLRQKIDDLFRFIKADGRNVLLRDIAYTLQKGRSHFPVRAALIVRDHKELELGLRKIIDNNYMDKTIKSNSEFDKAELQPASVELSRQPTKGLMSNRPDSSEYKNMLVSLADLYLRNYQINWADLHRDEVYRIVSLPTYPFEKERFWISESDRSKETASVLKAGFQQLHPLLHRNLSSFEVQKYSTTLTGDEFFLADHIYNNQKLFPAAAYIEMAATAVVNAGKPNIYKIKNIVWAKSLVVSENSQTEVHIVLSKKGEAVEFKIITPRQRNDDVLHSQGIFVYGNREADNQNIANIDIQSIKARCDRFISADEIYETFETMKFDYGTCFRTIKELYCNKKEALSVLELPKQLEADFDQYSLHPSLIDGALQTMLGLNHKRMEANGGFLPFSLSEINMLRPISKKIYVYLTYANNHSFADSTIHKYDLTIVNENGVVLSTMKEFSIKSIAKPDRMNSKLLQGNLDNPVELEDRKIFDVFSKVTQNELTIDRAVQLINGFV